MAENNSHRGSRKSTRSDRRAKALHSATTEVLEDRRLLSGTLDPSWGVGGSAVANLVGPVSARVTGLAHLSNGETIAVGVNAYGPVTVARYEEDGLLDTTFGNDGVEQFATAGSNFPFQAGVSYPQAFIDSASVFVQPDGKLLINLAWNGPTDLTVSWPFDVMRLNADGSKDTNFGNNGEVFLDFPNSSSSGSRAIGMTPSGDIVVAGDSILSTNSLQDISVGYLTSSGALDTTYGNGSGFVQAHLTNGTEFSQVDSLAFDQAGHLVVAGRLATLNDPYSSNLAVARFNTDGTLDTSFNSIGWVYTTGISQSVATQVAVGASGQVDITESSPTLAVLQYTAAGTLDTSFGIGGKVALNVGPGATAIPGTVQALSVLPDGELMAAGYDTTTGQLFSAHVSTTGTLLSGSLAGYVPGGSPITASILSDGSTIFGGGVTGINLVYNVYGLFVAELNAAGSLNTAYGTGGYTVTAVDGSISGHVSASVLQPDGKLIVGGTADATAFLVRFNTDGSLDTTFGINGEALVPFYFQSQSLDALGLQSNGDIVLDVHGGPAPSSKIELARLLPNGSLDPTFGTNNDGRIELQTLSAAPTPDDDATTMVIQPDDRIILAGITQNNFFAIRLTADGLPDNSFHFNGASAAPLGYPDTAVVAPNGDILIGGSSINFSTLKYTDDNLIRLLPNGNLDPAFGSSGMLNAPSTRIGSIAIQPDGKIVVGGAGDIERFNTSDGSLDQSFGTAGIVAAPLPPGSSQGTNDVAILSNGDILTAAAGSGTITLSELQSNGATDTSFGSNGTANSSAGVYGFANYSNGTNLGLFVRPSGNFVVTSDALAAPTSANYSYVAAQFTGSIAPMGGDVSGTVTAGGSAVSGATIYLDANNNSVFDSGEVSTTTGIDGSYSFTNVSTGSYVIRQVLPSGYSQTTPTGNGGIAVTIASGGNVMNENFADAVPPNSINTGWGGSGKVTSNFSTGGFTQATLLQADGKLLLGGSIYASQPGSVPALIPSFAIARFNADGSVDTSFGNHGQVVTSFTGGYDSLLGMALQSDGDIIAVGFDGPTADAAIESGPAGPASIAVVRYLPNGSLDTSFGTGGKVVLPEVISSGSTGSDKAYVVGIQSNGQIVIAGVGAVSVAGAAGPRNELFVVRLNADGSQDTSFDNGNAVYTQAWSGSSVAMAIDSKSNILLGSGANNDGGGADIRPNLIRLLPGGQLDAAFGTNGSANTGTFGYNGVQFDFEYINSIAVEPNGNIVIAGSGDQFTPTIEVFGPTGNGPQIDAVLPFIADEHSGVLSVQVLNNGDLLAVIGQGGPAYVSTPSPVSLVELLPTGALDTSFGTGGSAATNVYADQRQVSGDYSSAVVTPTGNIIAAGSANASGLGGFFAEEFNGSVAPAATNSVSGTVTGNAQPLAGVTVYLDGNNNGVLDNNELTAVTNVSGGFLFSGVSSGIYTLRQVIPGSYSQTTPVANAGFAIALSNGLSVSNENFIDAPTVIPGTISGTVVIGGVAVSGETVYLDTNNNSLLDAGELSTVTNGSGAYTFSGVPLGAYVIRQVLLTGYTQVTPAANAGISVSVSSASVFSNENFVDAPPATKIAQLKGTLIGTSGSYLNAGNTIAKAMDGNLSTYYDAATASGNWVGLDLGTPTVITSVAYASRNGYASRMNGGIFQGSNTADFSSGVVNLYTIASNANPSSSSLTNQTVTNTSAFRYVRYLSPANSNGNVAEVEFFGNVPVTPPPTNPMQLTGMPIGTAGSYLNGGNTFTKALDGNLNTFFDGATANGNWVGLDLGTPTVITSVAYASRNGYASRMNGGMFQASNTADFSSGVVTLYTIAANANPSSTTLTTQAISNSKAYRYVRYLSPNNSNGDVAEVQFFGTSSTTPPTITKFTGTTIGTSGSYQNDGNTIAKATDGSLSTFFDGATANGNWVGLDLGTAQIVKQISFAPRNGYSSRMTGGIFQASNTADFSTGVVNLYTVTASPAANVLTSVTINITTAYRYYRYLSPDGSEGDIAEVAFYG